MKKLKLSTFLVSFLTVIFIISLFIFPFQIIEAAKHGISLWFNNLFPALLPFIIGSNILIGVGVIDFIGVILEPIMKSIFNISGKGAFPCIMGIISGCPIGAKITADLRKSNQISFYDSIRIMSICNNSSPLFMLGTVSIGMFKNPKLGFYILIITYLAMISTSLIFRFYGISQSHNLDFTHYSKNLLKLAYRKQITNRIENYKNFGAILGDSIMNAMETITKIGGFVIFFSVISCLISLTPILPLLQYLFKPLLALLNVNENLYKGIILGIIEITNGIDIISSTNVPLKEQLLAAVCLLSWNGISIHAQVISMIENTDIKVIPYIVSKLIQTCFAFIYGYFIFTYLL